MDLTNAFFEVIGFFLICVSVRDIRKSKGYAGISLAQICFYCSWGLWNVVYYPKIGQTYSFFAGILVLIANATWVAHAIYYGKISSTSIDTK